MTLDARIDALTNWIDPATSLESYLDAIANACSETPDGVPLSPVSERQPDALQRMAEIFGLDDAAQTILSLAAAQAAGRLPADLTVGDLIRLVPGAIEALCPGAALRHWRLVELSGQGPLASRGLRLDERIFHHLRGTRYVDARLEGMVHPVGAADGADLDPRLGDAWRGEGTLPLVLLAGPDMIAMRQQSAAAATRLGLVLHRVSAKDLSDDWTQRAALAAFVDRELALSGAALLIEADGAAEQAAAFADLLCGPVLISAPDPIAPERAPRLRIDMPSLDRMGRRGLWQAALSGQGAIDPLFVERLAAQFQLDARTIETVAGAGPDPAALWSAARAQGRAGLDGLAQRIEAQAGWDDLVVPAETKCQLQDIAAALATSWRIAEDWGWGARSGRGLGLAALFSGASGTGKTFAAEIIAAELDLDLFRIDLSQVVSKYIGETEKNLSRIFAAAERSGAILLFDEADALFGKRSEVKDSHDRHANVEVSYLLQQMESYRGLAILTTNLKGALDQAFLRRLRFVVSFGFPDQASRARIWARIFPPETPTDGLKPERLARLNLTGGAIRSVALNASSLAAAEGQPVGPGHVLRATRREYAKLEKSLTPGEMEAFR